MISIVIPTLNAEAGLAQTLDRVSPDRHVLVREVIVSDGGSSDSTIEIAKRARCRIFQGPACRGGQLRLGVRQAAGRWLLFLRAQTRLGPNWEAAANDFIRRAAGKRCAGVFTFKLDDNGRRARLLERIVAVHGRLLGFPSGDQGLLLSRSFYDDVGGFRPLPLMEDVDLIQRIGLARLEVLPVSAVSGTDLYGRNGYIRRTLGHCASVALCYAGVPPRWIARVHG